MMASKLKSSSPIIKKTVAKVKTKKLLASFSKFKTTQSIIGASFVALIGAYYVITTLAGSDKAVSRAADTIVMEYITSHGHGSDTSALPQFNPEAAILYGNGLLLCGVETAHEAGTNPLNSTQLTNSQVQTLISSITNTGLFKSADSAMPKDLGPIGEAESITVNFLGGAKQSAFFTGAKSPALQQAENIINSKCSNVTTPYLPEGVVLNTRKTSQSAPGVALVDGNGLSLPDSTEPTTKTTYGLEAKGLLSKFGKRSKVTLTAGSSTYDATIQPILPTAKPITFKQASGTAIAASYAPMRMYWFYPAELSNPDPNYNTIYPAVSYSIRSFYAAQEYNKAPSAINAGLVHGQHTSAYYHACQAGQTCTSDGDMNAYNNVRAEMKARGYEPNNQAVVVLSQIPSSRGVNWCYGYGGPEGSVTNALTTYGTGFAISFGYYPTTTHACEAGTLRYWNTAHEYGHVLGFVHTCGEVGSLMDGCLTPAYNAAWPSFFHINSGQRSDANLHSAGLNQRITGRVVNGSTGVAISGARIFTCTGLDTVSPVKTNSTGVFDFRLTTNAGFCIRVTSGAPTGYKATTNNNIEHAGVGTFEYQVAGKNCYHNTTCNSAQQTWDRTVDYGYSFSYKP